MRSKPINSKAPAERVLKDIRRATRRHFSAEDKIRIVLDGLRGEDSIAELCRREGIAQSRQLVFASAIRSPANGSTTRRFRENGWRLASRCRCASRVWFLRTRSPAISLFLARCAFTTNI